MNKKEYVIPFPFDSENFRTEGHKTVDILADYLKDIMSGSDVPVLPWYDPDELARILSFESGGGEKEPLEDFTKRILKYSNHLHHPRYVGHQVTCPFPVVSLVQLCTTLINNAAAVYEMGPAVMAMERNVIKRFTSMIGFTDRCDGIFTHGGSTGNLTSLLAARQVMSDYNIWEEGIKGNDKPAYLVSDLCHYSIARNIKIMGLGDSSAIKIPYDRDFRMDTSMLEESLLKAEKEGLKVIAVVANACSTAVGAYDNLDSIADFCEKHNLWMHVDGAHGMGVLFSDRFRNRVRGIERADSIVIDFHKMFLVPGLNTMVLFKNGEKSYETFAQKATYLFQKSQNNEWSNSASRALECSKSAMGIIAYTALKYYGNSYYREYIESRYDLATTFASMARSKPDFEIITEPQSNIVCFRFAPAGYSSETLNEVNASIRQAIMEEGSFYTVQADIEGKRWLRVTILNPVTSEEDLEYLLERVKDIGTKLLNAF